MLFILTSCQNNDQNRTAENKRELEKREVIFKNIEKGWVFYDSPLTEASENSSASWNEWRLFLEELAQKPKKTIGAFQQKSKAITKKALALNDNIPSDYSIPPIKSRISALIAKVQMLDLYINLDVVPDKKVTKLVAEINLELVSLQRQMEKTVDKKKIPVEEGESDLMNIIVASRAIPSTPITDPNMPRVE